MELSLVVLDSSDFNDNYCADLAVKDDDGYKYIGEIVYKEDAEYLAKAGNMHHKLVAALEEARLQIEYLHSKFKATGSGNSVLAEIDELLKRAKDEN